MPANGHSIHILIHLPAVPAKITEHSKYCVICTPLGKICPEGFAELSDWDENKEDQAKDKDKDNIHKQSKTTPSFSTVMTITVKPPEPFITIYFNSMPSETPIMYTPKEKHRYDTIMIQQELNTTKHEVQDQDSLEDKD